MTKAGLPLLCSFAPDRATINRAGVQPVVVRAAETRKCFYCLPLSFIFSAGSHDLPNFRIISHSVPPVQRCSRFAPPSTGRGSSQWSRRRLQDRECFLSLPTAFLRCSGEPRFSESATEKSSVLWVQLCFKIAPPSTGQSWRRRLRARAKQWPTLGG